MAALVVEVTEAAATEVAAREEVVRVAARVEAATEVAALAVVRGKVAVERAAKRVAANAAAKQTRALQNQQALLGTQQLVQNLMDIVVLPFLFIQKW